MVKEKVLRRVSEDDYNDLTVLIKKLARYAYFSRFGNSSEMVVSNMSILSQDEESVNQGMHADTFSNKYLVFLMHITKGNSTRIISKENFGACNEEDTVKAVSTNFVVWSDEAKTAIRQKYHFWHKPPAEVEALVTIEGERNPEVF